MHSLNRSDWMVRPKAELGVSAQLAAGLSGVDVFGGRAPACSASTIKQDRVYTELRHDF